MDPHSGGTGAVLEGKIEAGDFDKLRKFIFLNLTEQVYLASPGGELAEAMKIGRLLRGLKLSTIVPARFPSADLQKQAASMHGLQDAKANFLCASACFFIFVAGIHRDSDLSSDGILGIHRPYLSDADLRALAPDNAMAQATRARSLVEQYARDMGVAGKYVDKMFAVSKDEIRWINDDEFASDFLGFIPELADWVGARCSRLTDTEKRVWEAVKNKTGSQMTEAERIMSKALLLKLSEQDRCEAALQSDLATEGYKNAAQVLSKMPN
jgi:hypothetical protein